MGDKTYALICAYNEHGTIAEVVQRTLKQVRRVLVVNDGSTDNTAELAKKAGATVYNHETNLGKGQALKNGFAWLNSMGCERVITLDADLQHLPEEIPSFLESLDQGNNVVIGKRNFQESCVPKVRRFSNTLYARVLSSISKKPVYDPECGYRAFQKEMLPKLVGLTTTRGFSYESEMLMKLLLEETKIGWVDISTVYIPGRKSKISPIKHTFNSIEVVLQCLVDQAKQKLKR